MTVAVCAVVPELPFPHGFRAVVPSFAPHFAPSPALVGMACKSIPAGQRVYGNV